MQKQSLIPRCLCGQAIKFPKRKNKSHCRTEGCGVRWERGPEGYRSTPWCETFDQAQKNLDALASVYGWKEIN